MPDIPHANASRRGDRGDLETSFAEMLGHHHADTRSHSARVGRYAAELASALKERTATGDIPTPERMDLLGRLHDVGKLAVPEWVLNWSQSKLPPDGWREILAHPARGAALLAPIPGAESLLPAVLTHHENYDGSGYPFGLAGADIPLEGRILRIADTFDAMTSARSYQKSLDRPDAIARLQELAGSAFDPELVDTFVEMLASNPRAQAIFEEAHGPGPSSE